MAQVGLLEDNARIAKLCVMMLHYAGHHVTVYQHPDECLRALLAQPVIPDGRTYLPRAGILLPIDVLVLDLHLPDMNGTEVIRILQSYSHTCLLPVIFCSAASPHEISRALRIAPRATFVEKPFTFQDLTIAIDQAIATQSK
jgi:CheY-like chemotaxis protein